MVRVLRFGFQAHPGYLIKTNPLAFRGEERLVIFGPEEKPEHPCEYTEMLCFPVHASIQVMFTLLVLSLFSGEISN